MVDSAVVSQKEGPVFKLLATWGPLSVVFACFPCIRVGSLRYSSFFPQKEDADAYWPRMIVCFCV